MTEQAAGTSRLDVDQYVEIQSRLHRLKSQLPKQSVENLAREVIRQLVAEAHDDVAQTPTNDQIALLCQALISDDDAAGARIIQDVRSKGASIEEIYLNYLSESARMLGVWWEEDRVTFAEVTVGTSRMYAIMRILRHQLPLADPSSRKAAVFASVPGETHMLGVRMAADLFRKDGWDIDLLIGRAHDELVFDISRSDVVVVGLSARSERTLEALSKIVIALRIKNPKLALFVSGSVVEEHKDTVELMDVDGMASDYQSAKDMLEAYVSTS